MLHSLKFRKSERLCNIKDIDNIFKGKLGVFSFPLKVCYSYSFEDTDHNPDIKILFSVGKKYSKLAVKRNIIKRRSKEAYRLCKEDIINEACLPKGCVIKICFIYISRKEESYETIQASVKRCFSQVLSSITAHSDNNTDASDKVL